MRYILFSLLLGCYVVDPLDGDIESPEACCYHWPDEEAAHECALDFARRAYEATGIHHCQDLECSLVGYKTRACTREDVE